MSGRREVRPDVRAISAGGGWQASEFICTAGPEDRPFEEQHGSFAIAAVVAGVFSYHTDTGRGLLHPGSVLLGNAGQCFECGHDHSRGDRCIAFSFSAEIFEEIALSSAGSHRFRFNSPLLPAGPALLPTLTVLFQASQLRAAEASLDAAAAVVGASAGYTPAPVKVSPADERRVAAALRHMESHFRQNICLDDLAAMAGVSKYHFLRIFRRTVGLSPHQFLVHHRLQCSAERLITTPDPIAHVALACGFEDLSTFNHRFRMVFGQTPGQYRLQHCRSGSRAK